MGRAAVRGLTAAGAVVLALTAVAACGGGDGGPKRPGPSASSKGTAPNATSSAGTSSTGTASSGPASGQPGTGRADAAPVPLPTFTGRPVLSVAQLKRLTFKEGGTPGTYGMPVTVLNAAPPATPTLPTPTPAACADPMALAFGKHATAGLSQLVNWKADPFPGATVLASYPRGGAARVFQVVKADLARCHTESGYNYVGPYTATFTAETAPEVGDEALRFRVAVPVKQQDDVHYDDYVFVRVGDATALFDMTDVGRTTAFPADLIRTQVQRLAAAQR